MGFGQVLSFGRAEQRWKVCLKKGPANGLRPIRELVVTAFNQLASMDLVSAEIAKLVPMPQCKSKRLRCVIEAEHVQLRADLSRAAQHRQHIGGSAQADIPNNKLTAMFLQPVGQSQLLQVKSFGLGERPNDRMEGLAMKQRVNAVRAIRQFDELIARTLRHTHCDAAACVLEVRPPDDPLASSTASRISFFKPSIP